MGQRDATNDFPGDDSYMVAATLRQRRGNSSELVRITVKDAASYERELSGKESHRHPPDSGDGRSAPTDLDTPARTGSPGNAAPAAPQAAPDVKLAPFEFQLLKRSEQRIGEICEETDQQRQSSEARLVALRSRLDELKHEKEKNRREHKQFAFRDVHQLISTSVYLTIMGVMLASEWVFNAKAFELVEPPHPGEGLLGNMHYIMAIAPTISLIMLAHYLGLKFRHMPGLAQAGAKEAGTTAAMQPPAADHPEAESATSPDASPRAAAASEYSVLRDRNIWIAIGLFFVICAASFALAYLRAESIEVKGANDKLVHIEREVLSAERVLRDLQSDYDRAVDKKASGNDVASAERTMVDLGKQIAAQDKRIDTYREEAKKANDELEQARREGIHINYAHLLLVMTINLLICMTGAFATYYSHDESRELEGIVKHKKKIAKQWDRLSKELHALSARYDGLITTANERIIREMHHWEECVGEYRYWNSRARKGCPTWYHDDFQGKTFLVRDFGHESAYLPRSFGDLYDDHDGRPHRPPTADDDAAAGESG
jgi:hypothetical protein